MRVIQRVVSHIPTLPSKKRVAAYARVSVKREEKLRSLSAQVSHYSAFIQNNHEWEYAGVYADDVTGTKDSRPEFQRLLADCRAGKVDIVLTKSISRFARNTVTMLETVRELKAIDVDVWFERENIRSLSGDGELMLTILASFAQEESLSNSENMKWRFKRRFEQGRPSTTIMFGYKLVDEKFIIVPDEAEAVRLIFNDFINGATRAEIVDKLDALGFKPLYSEKWNYSTINCMLRNEKYAGILLLQKHFRENHMTKAARLNRGELPQFRIEDNHPAIINIETFEKAQELLKQTVKPRRTRRQKKEKVMPQRVNREKHPFTGKIFCGICGEVYTRSVNRKGTKTEYIAWSCYTYSRRGKSACPAPHVPERVLLGIGSDFEKIVVKSSEELSVTINGMETFMPWHRRTCKEAWTPEKRQAAREKAIAYWERRQAVCPQHKE